LLHDVPLELQIEDLAWNRVNESKLLPLFDELEFRTLKERIKVFAGEASPTKSPAPEPLMMLQFDPDLELLSPDELDKRISAHSGDLAITYELDHEKLHRYAVALSPSESFLIHSSQMGTWVSDPGVGKILHDAKGLARVVDVEGIVFDTALAAYVINPGVRAQELGDIATRWGGGASISSSDPEKALLQGAMELFNLRKSLEQELKARNVLGLYKDLELPIAELLAKMERIGITVDMKGLSELQKFFASEAERETNATFEAVGHEFNVASPKQLQVVLFEELKLPKTKKIKTGYTTDAESLEWLSETTKHPVLAHLLRIRETNKLRTTVDGLISEIATDGRIHTHFQQTVAATGRLSSTGPNLQNIPVRTEEGRRIRQCFVAGKGFESLLTADYSQIEMRIMAHLSLDEHLLAAFTKGEDLHSTVASEVFNVEAKNVSPEMRRQIKAMSYGLAYGLSSFGLGAQLGISPPEAQILMDKYFERFGSIRDYLKTVVEQARKVGYTETILGRRRYLPDLLHDNRARREVAERMALNAPIQGSAADIIKAAMLNVERAINTKKLKSRLLLQVHDELIFEVSKGEGLVLTDLVRQAMGSAYPLKAPLEVSVGIGKSWNEAAH
jgi:DNA polymerase-1